MKKLIYLIFCSMILIISLTRYFIVLDNYIWYEIVLSIMVYLLCCICFIFPEKTILFVHWYMKNKSIDEFSDGFILLNKILFAIGMILGSIMPLFLSGPIVL